MRTRSDNISWGMFRHLENIFHRFVRSADLFRHSLRKKRGIVPGRKEAGQPNYMVVICTAELVEIKVNCKR